MTINERGYDLQGGIGVKNIKKLLYSHMQKSVNVTFAPYTDSYSLSSKFFNSSHIKYEIE